MYLSISVSTWNGVTAYQQLNVTTVAERETELVRSIWRNAGAAIDWATKPGTMSQRALVIISLRNVRARHIFTMRAHVTISRECPDHLHAISEYLRGLLPKGTKVENISGGTA